MISLQTSLFKTQQGVMPTYLTLCFHFPWFLALYEVVMYQSNQSLNIPHPGNPAGIWTFGKFLFKFPPPEAEKLFKCPIISPFQLIKCPHPGKLFTSFYYAPEAVYVNMVYRQHSYMPKIIQIVLEYLQIQSKACANLCFSASLPRIGYLSLWMHEGLFCHDLSCHVESAWLVTLNQS